MRPLEHRASAKIGSYFLAFLGILFVRFLFENLSSATVSGTLGSDIYTLIHYYLFYLSLGLALILLLDLFFPRLRPFLFAIVTFGFLITWIAPLLDLLLSGGEGIRMAYLFQQSPELLKSFATFFGPLVYPGITPGIRIEIAIILLSLFIGAYFLAKSFLKAFATALSAYAIFFFFLSFPSLVKILHDFFTPAASEAPSVTAFFVGSVNRSFLPINLLHPTAILNSTNRFYEIMFNAAFSQLYFVLISILILSIAYRLNRQKLLAVLGNSRPERVLHYFLLVLLGFSLALHDPRFALLSWLNMLSILVTLIVFYCAWQFAVGINDLSDEVTDETSNSNRPLIKKSLSRSDIRFANTLFAGGALVGSIIVSQYLAFFVIVFSAAYYIYSAPPFRLKRFPVIAPFLISVACLAAFMGGFYLASANKTMAALPFEWTLLILIVFTLAANVKDIKDYAGDRKDSVYTIPVLLGERRGKQLIGLLLALAYLAIPLILGIPILWFISIPAALAGFWLVNGMQFKERNIFALYFAYAISLLLLL